MLYNIYCIMYCTSIRYINICVHIVMEISCARGAFIYLFRYIYTKHIRYLLYKVMRDLSAMHVQLYRCIIQITGV